MPPTKYGRNLDERRLLYRFSIKQYQKMLAQGVIAAGDRVELVSGLMLSRPPSSPEQERAEERLKVLMENHLPAPWVVVEHRPMLIGFDSRTIPELTVVPGPAGGADAEIPAESCDLVIQMVEPISGIDRRKRASIYAAAGVPVYWLADFRQASVTVLSGPKGVGPRAKYQDENVYDHDAEVPVVISGSRMGAIPVADIFS